jgi:agmatine deiminase
VYGEIVRHLTPGEFVRIIVSSAAHETAARRVLMRLAVNMTRVEFIRWPTNRGWTRDFMPAFVKRAGKIDAVHFQFNAWAKYSDWPLDAAVPPRVAKHLGVRLAPARAEKRHIVLEGGAIDSNGAGTLLTTEECLLDPAVQVRNPGFSREDWNRAFESHLGVKQVIWLGKGIAGDDTHGHVDDLCRFVSRDTVVLCEESDQRDDNYGALKENRDRLAAVRLANGSRLKVVPLPMPAPLLFEGRRLPASYANFYIGNRVVLVPTFNDPHDRAALGILGELFPSRTVIGIHAVDLVWGLGTLHCLTHEEPAK